MAAGTALAIGMGAGALAGGIKGLQGTPDQVQNTNQSSQLFLGEKSDRQKQLEDISYGEYERARAQQAALERSLAGQYGLDAAQLQARQAAQGIVGGEAFGVTPQEAELIAQQRAGIIEQGQADIDRFLDERLRGVQESAGARGLRGQAVTSLQGDVLQEGARQYGDVVRQANQMSLERQAQTPYQRIGAQSPFIQQGFTSADVMRQQAMANRMALQNPMLLQQLQQERLATGRQVGSGQNVQEGQQGSLLGGLTGGLTGGLQGGAIGGNIYRGFGGFGGSTPTSGGQQVQTTGQSTAMSGAPYVDTSKLIG